MELKYKHLKLSRKGRLVGVSPTILRLCLLSWIVLWNLDLVALWCEDARLASQWRIFSYNNELKLVKVYAPHYSIVPNRWKWTREVRVLLMGNSQEWEVTRILTHQNRCKGNAWVRIPKTLKVWRQQLTECLTIWFLLSPSNREKRDWTKIKLRLNVKWHSRLWYMKLGDRWICWMLIVLV